MWKTRLNRILAVMSIVASSALTNADDKADAQAILDKGIKAHGGVENLAKFKAVRVKMEGKQPIESFFWDATAVVTYQMPDKIRLESEVQNPEGRKFPITQVVDGNKGWRGSATRSRDLKDTQVAQILDGLYAPWLASLVPLVGRGFDLATVGETNVDDRPVVGIRVSFKGKPDVNLYFEKKTGLLLKSERRAKDMNDQEYTAESFYRDHKAFHGAMWPTKRIDKRDGADLDNDAGKFAFADYQPLEAIDPTILAKP